MKDMFDDLLNDYRQEIDFSLIDTLALNKIKKELSEFCSLADETEKTLLRILESATIFNCDSDRNEIKKYIERLLVFRRIKERVSKMLEIIDDDSII